jgi:hypothetical protein
MAQYQLLDSLFQAPSAFNLTPSVAWTSQYALDMVEVLQRLNYFYNLLNIQQLITWDVKRGQTALIVY